MYGSARSMVVSKGCGPGRSANINTVLAGRVAWRKFSLQVPSLRTSSNLTMRSLVSLDTPRTSNEYSLLCFLGGAVMNLSGRRARTIAGIFVSLLILSGCQAVRSGGAPDLSFDVNADLLELSEQLKGATNITEYYKNPSQIARDKFITGRLVQIDLRYLIFLRTLTADKQQLDSAVDIATLTLNLAGTLVGAARAKTNLAAAAAGIGGSKTSIDKHFYYEKSIEALVATMNGRRKEVLAHILQALDGDHEEYRLTQAVVDLNQYYLAGTLNGAIAFIQSDAGQKEKVADDKLERIKYIRSVALLKPEEQADKRSLTRAIGAGDLSLDRANAAVRALKGADQADLVAAKNFLQDAVRAARSPEQIAIVKKAFTAGGVLK